MKDKIIKIVTDPDFYSYKHALEIKNSGFPLDGYFVYDGEYLSLLDILFLTENRRYNYVEISGKNKSIQGAAIDALKASEADQICRLLVNSGVRLTRNSVLNEHHCSPSFYNYLYLSDSSKKFRRGPIIFLMDKFSLEHPGVIAEFDLRCQGKNQVKLGKILKSIMTYPLESKADFKSIKEPLLALFHYCSDINEEILVEFEEKIKGYGSFRFYLSFRDYSRDDAIQWVRELHQQREKEPFYQNWTKYVEQAKQALGELITSLNVEQQEVFINSSEDNVLSELDVVDAFSKPPVLLAAMNNEEKILRILQHYYRRPGPERVISSLLSHKTIPEVWKPIHACSHVLRARNNVLWYIEWLEKFQSLSFSDDEKSLLMLAIIYHDAAAEDVLKKMKKKVSGLFQT